MRDRLEARMYRSMDRFTNWEIAQSASPLQKLVIEQAYRRDKATLEWFEECQRVASGLRVYQALNGADEIRQEAKPVWLRMEAKHSLSVDLFEQRLSELTDGHGIEGEPIPLDSMGLPLINIPLYHRY